MIRYQVEGYIKGKQEGPGTISKVIYAEDEDHAREKYLMKVESDVRVEKVEKLDG